MLSLRLNSDTAQMDDAFIYEVSHISLVWSKIEFIQDKLQYLAGQPSGYIETLPKKVRRRVTVLQEIQVGVNLATSVDLRVFWFFLAFHLWIILIFDICFVISYALQNGSEDVYNYEDIWPL